MLVRRRKRFLLLLLLCVASALIFYIANDGMMVGPRESRSREVHRDTIVVEASGRSSPTLHLTKDPLSKSSRTETPSHNEKQHLQEQLQQQEVLKDRQQRMKTVCRIIKSDPKYLGSKIPRVNVAQRFLHCPLTKAASTFWGRFVLTVNRSGVMRSPFTEKLHFNPKPLPSTKLTEIGNISARREFVDNSFKSMFVREPYHRVLSAYVDKILGPNPYFWKEWGMEVYRRAYPRGSRSSITGKELYIGGAGPGNKKYCFHNISFAQVMKAAAPRFYKREMHFVPASRWCSPCDFRYDFIGKMETFSQDLRLLSTTLHLNLTDYFASREFSLEYVRDAVEDSIFSPFSWLKDVKRCISKFHMGLRIWRKLQIRGLVDRRIPFPFSESEFQRVQASQLVEKAMDAHARSTDRAELQRQKKDAFLEAYRTVGLESLERFRKAFADDFLMFGYDPSPAGIFEGRDVPLNVTGAFDWSRPWGGG